MYVCVCNSLTEESIAKAARSGANAVSRIYAALDCAPQCGRCLPKVRGILEAAAGGPGPRPVPETD